MTTPNFDSLKSMRAAQRERHRPHMDANTREGVMARLSPISDTITDWFVREVMRDRPNPVDIIEAYNDLAAACLSMIVRSTAMTMRNSGTHTLSLGALGQMSTDDALATFAVNDFLSSVSNYQNKQDGFVRTTGQQAVKDIGA